MTTAEKNAREAMWRKHMPTLYAQSQDKPTPALVDLIIDMCHQLDLDPLLKHIVPFRGQPYVTEMGLMQVANRSGLLDGMNNKSEFTDPDGKGMRWIATTTVYKKGCAYPFTFDSDQKEYENLSSPVWKKNPRSQTEKCGTCKTIRHAFDIGLCSIEEMAVDETTGMSAEEVRAKLLGEEKTEAGNPNAQASAENKQAAKDAKKAAKAAQSTPDQFKFIGWVYTKFGWKRPESESVFRSQFPGLEKTHAENSLTGEQSTQYAAYLLDRLVREWSKELHLDAAALKLAMGDAEKFSDIPHTVDAWNTVLNRMKWAGVRCMHKALGQSDEDVDAEFVNRFPEASTRADVADKDLLEYIRELQDACAGLNDEPAIDEPKSEAKPSEEQGTLI